MIIKIDRGQPELRLFVDFPPGEEKSAAELRLHIRPPEDKHFAQLSPLIAKGEWSVPRDNFPPDRHRWPVLIYPALGVAPEGEAVFRLDEKLWRRPPGRWLGEVWWRKWMIASMDIDCRPQRWILSGVRAAGGYEQ